MVSRHVAQFQPQRLISLLHYADSAKSKENVNELQIIQPSLFIYTAHLMSVFRRWIYLYTQGGFCSQALAHR